MAERGITTFVAISASVLGIACSSGAQPTDGARTSDPLSVCVLDGAICVNVPDADLPPLPFDGGLPVLGDAAAPAWPDVVVPPSVDAGAGDCPLDPKYVTEYAQQVQGNSASPCGSCSASQCCFLGLSCVAR